MEFIDALMSWTKTLCCNSASGFTRWERGKWTVVR